MATDRSKKSKALTDTSKKLVMLAHNFSAKKHVITPTNSRQVSILDWQIFEKIDGIRAIVKNNKLVSRYGNPFSAPKEFIQSISTTYGDLFNGLDGELVSSKGFQDTTSVVRDKTNKNTMDYWKDITYVVFDHQKINSRFCERLDILRDKVSKLKYSRILLPLRSISSMTDIEYYIDKVAKDKGEGLIIRNPDALYEKGRSWNLLKYKIFDDTEAKVITHIKGEGKYENMLGKIVCSLLSDGTIFECGSGFTDAERINPPKIGAVVTIQYMGLTEDGLPRHPVYKGERNYE